MQPLGLRSVTLTEKPSEGGVYSETNIDAARLDGLRDPEVRAQVDTALRGTGISSSVVVARMETGAQNAALERQWIADDLARVAERDGLNLERRADLETARETLNRAHVQLGVALERAGVLRDDGVVEDRTVTERFHYHPDAAETMERAIRQDMRAEGLIEQQIEAREWEIASRAERRIEEEQRSYLDVHPELLARPSDVIDRSEPYRERITDEARAREVTREVDRIMEGRDARTPVADAVTEEFRARYPDMPSHLARGLGATYAAVTELRDTEAIDQVRRENELRKVALDLRDGRLSGEREREAVEGAPIADPDIRRVVDHERAGNLHSPFQDEGQRLAYRDAVERDLDAAQIDRLRDGDVDVLKERIGDRLDRLYAAKTYLQSDAATANSEATRAVVEEIADREFELHRADLVDGESERGETH